MLRENKNQYAKLPSPTGDRNHTVFGGRGILKSNRTVIFICLICLLLICTGALNYDRSNALEKSNMTTAQASAAPLVRDEQAKPAPSKVPEAKLEEDSNVTGEQPLEPVPEPVPLTVNSVQTLNFVTSISPESCSLANSELSRTWRQKLPKNLMITIAMGYSYDRYRFLVNSFLEMTKTAPEPVGLLIFSKVPEDWKIIDEHIFFVEPKFIESEEAKLKALPFVYARFLYYKCFLEAMDLDARIFTLDARDTIIQKYPFVYPNDNMMRFYYESGNIRDVQINKVWLASCSNETYADHFGATQVVNDGTIYGPSKELLKYLTWFVTTILKKNCNDQGLHIYAVVSGEIMGVVRFRMETNEWGRVFTGCDAGKLVRIDDNQNVISKVTDEVYTIIHQFDRVNHIADRVRSKFQQPPAGTRLIN